MLFSIIAKLATEKEERKIFMQVRIKKVLICFFITVLVLIPFLSYGGTAYFQSGAETGDLSEWKGDGGGGIYYEPHVEVTTKVARSGKYSIRCYLADPSVAYNAKLMRWRIDQKNAYYSAWYYFDKNYDAKQWSNIMQWKTDPPGEPGSNAIEPTFFLEALLIDNIRQLRLFHWPVALGYLPPDPPHQGQFYPGKYAQSNPIPLPDETWIHVEAYYKTDRVNGEVIVWQDGVEIFRVGGVNTQDSIKQAEFVMFGVGNYLCNCESANQLLYVDDIIVADYQVSADMTPATPKNFQIVK